MPQALQTGDVGIGNVLRRFYSIFKDPFSGTQRFDEALKVSYSGLGNPIYRVRLSASRFVSKFGPIWAQGTPEVTLSVLRRRGALALARPGAMTLFPPFPPASLPLEMLFVLVRTVVSSASCTVFRQ